MDNKYEYMNPNDIEKHSFEIIEQELEIELPSDIKPIVKRVIHTTADFSYAENMYFSPDAIKTALGEIKSGVTFVTDTNMALSGINKKALKELNCNAVCYVSDEDVAVMAKKENITRAVCAVKKAAMNNKRCIMVVGNAPTALIQIEKMYRENEFKPLLVIGVPVGFVNAVDSKEAIIDSGMECIIARGRKGGSNVAASIVNALLYMCQDDNREWRR